MPTTPRKNSLGGTSRRGPLKAHIPYRGDNPEVGKKTGIAVQHVARQSDGFEPFDQVLQQADGRTPPRPNAKSNRSSYRPVARTSDIDFDKIPSPPRPNTSSRKRTNSVASGSLDPGSRSSFRPVARTSDIDFDKIPSPRPNTSPRKSTNSVASGSLHAGDRSPSKVSPRKTSFRGIEEEEEEDFGGQEEEEPLQDLTPVFEQDEDDDFGGQEEEEILQDLTPRFEQEEDDDNGGQEKTIKKRKPLQDIVPRLEQEEDNDNGGQEEKRKRKRKPPQDLAPRLEQEEDDDKGEQKEKKKKKRKPLQELSPRLGVRRSQREHYRPLEYWRGEKLVYGRTSHSGPILVPQIKEIVRIPKEVSLPLGTKRKRGSTRARSRSKVSETVEGVIPPALPVVDPEEGWDDDTEAKCTVIHFTSKEEVERRIAWTAKMVDPREAAGSGWLFDKIFGDDEFIAAGQLVIPPRGRKPSKAAKDNTYVFYVIEGAVNFKIHDTSMILATGGMFMVPRGNTYFIENICERDAKLFFTQARKVVMNGEEMAARDEVAAELQRRKSIVRSSSAGAQSAGRMPTSPSLSDS